MKSIYGIFDKKTRECKYIGQTSNYKRRCSVHTSTSNSVNSKIYNYPIYIWMRQNDYYFRELVIVEDFMALETENNLMELFKDTILNLNFMNQGPNRGKVLSEEIKNKMSNATKKKPISQFDLQNNFIRSYDSIKEAYRDGFDLNGIYKCCNGVLKKHKGFIWRYV